MNFNFVKYSKLYYIFSGILILGSILSLSVFGLKFGIDFTGGSIMEVEFPQNSLSNQEIMAALSQFNLGEVTLQPTGDKGIIIRMKAIDEETHQKIVKTLGAKERYFELIGPSVGRDLKKKTIVAIILALISITIYISLAFRKVYRPVASWQYGIATLVALFHDLLIPLGVFAYLGKFYNAEITIPIVTALLTVLGFSVHDTIVIFDRVRENLLQRVSHSFEEVINRSLNQTLARSINTVLTVIFVLLAIYFFGGQTLKFFSLALILGIVSGAYSSIFIASPLLVSWLKRQEK